jgi:hypothetical protein
MEEVDRSIDSVVRGSTRGRQTRRSSRGGRVGRPPGVRRGTSRNVANGIILYSYTIISFIFNSI